MNMKKWNALTHVTFVRFCCSYFVHVSAVVALLLTIASTSFSVGHFARQSLWLKTFLVFFSGEKIRSSFILYLKSFMTDRNDKIRLNHMNYRRPLPINVLTPNKWWWNKQTKHPYEIKITSVSHRELINKSVNRK